LTNEIVIHTTVILSYSCLPYILSSRLLDEKNWYKQNCKAPPTDLGYVVIGWEESVDQWPDS